VINISGGTFDYHLLAGSGGEINLFGSNFAIDGVPVNGLQIDETLTIDDRDVNLSGLLADGSEFRFNLNSLPREIVSRNATLTVTQAVPQVMATGPASITHVPFFTLTGASNGDSFFGESFGESLSDAGDVNGDGFDDLIIGARDADNNGTNSGRILVVSGFNSTVLYSLFGDAASDLDDFIVGAVSNAKVFSGSDGSVLYNFEGDFSSFGSSVSSAGDVNGDGFDDVVVGASDSVRVFSGSDGSVLYNFDSVILGGLDLSRSVSGAGDVNGDGFDDLIVGSPSNSNALVFSGSDGSVLYNFNGDSDFQQRLGDSVSDAGDVNGDGFDDVIVGAGDSSSARVFSGADGSLLYQFDGFGFSVSGAGDVNNDGFADLITGAQQIGDYGQIFGSARVFSGADGSVLYELSENVEGFGNSVSGAGDVNGDGVADFVVGGIGVRGGTDVVGASSLSRVRVDVSRLPIFLSSLGDVDQDGEVTFADIAPFIEVLMNGTFLEEADCNQDGEVNFDDIESFIALLTAA